MGMFEYLVLGVTFKNLVGKFPKCSSKISVMMYKNVNRNKIFVLSVHLKVVERKTFVLFYYISDYILLSLKENINLELSDAIL